MRKEYSHITLIRSVAILLVVLGHATAVFEAAWGGQPQINFLPLSIVCRVIKTFHMPLFMSISGFLFYSQFNQSIPESFQKHMLRAIPFLKKKAYRLILPLILVKFLWVTPVRFFSGYYASNDSNTTYFQCLLNTDVGHLWFLYVLFSIFVIQYVLCYFYKNNRTKLTITMLFSAIIGYAAMISGISVPIANILRYNYYFVLGEIIFAFWNDEVKFERYLMGGSLIIAMSLTTVLVCGIIPKRSAKLFVELLLASIDVVLVHKYANIICGKVGLAQTTKRVIGVISEYSMGIYLFHEPILYYVLSIFHAQDPFVLCAILFASGMVGSVLITYIIRAFRLFAILGEKSGCQ